MFPTKSRSLLLVFFGGWREGGQGIRLQDVLIVVICGLRILKVGKQKSHSIFLRILKDCYS